MNSMANPSRTYLPLILAALLVGPAREGSTGCAAPGISSEPRLFYPAPPQRPRLQWLTRFVAAEDVEGREGWLVRFLVGEPAQKRRLRKPTGIAAHDGVIFVADPGWDTVVVLDLEHRVFDTLHDRGDGKLQVPVDIAIDAEGNKFIADTGRNQVVQFNARNEFVRSYGNPTKMRPTGVVVDEEYLYVVNRAKHRVEVVDRRSGETIRTFGSFGKHDGQFNTPTSLCRDENGHFFVTDAVNFRVQELDAEGEFVKSYGFLGDGPGTFARPKGVAVDREGHLFTVDAAFENVQIWDAETARVLLAFGGPGVAEGNMYLPSSVFVSYDLAPYFEDFVDNDFALEYVVLVANNYGPNRVGVYGFVEPKDPDRYPDWEPEEEPDEPEESRE